MESRYANGKGYFHGSPSQPNTNLRVNNTTNGSTMNLNGNEAAESSKLDHALLESLFYNEMMMIDDASPSSSSLISHFNEATHHALTHPSASDPKTIAEKEMLQDFGVTASTILHAPQKPPEASWVPNAAVDTAAAVAAAGPSQSSHAPTYPASQQLSLKPSPTLAPSVASNPQLLVQPKSSVQPATKPHLSIDTTHPPVPHERAKQLVDQFATLASRLGIDLPTNVLQSLTAAAARNNPELPAVVERKQLTASPPLQPKMNVQNNSSSSIPPTVEELRRTAEEAIAAVSKKRAPEGQPNATTIASTNKPLYSKRRKKPRLSDCESRLAELKAENELLKRHLKNLSNKAHRFDKEKEDAGKRIEQLHAKNAVPEEMDNAVKEFSDMYSDYGVNRQQELSFHLEQLQRLVNPTNFTKMGLWTLGRNASNPKSNPIAGILQKELGITPQQGRKILDQSEKIRALCDNLKECLSLLAKLKSLCQQKTRIFQDRMNKCREILTTKQVVKLIVWINEHTQLLESVCPGWGTEHIH